MSCLGYGDGIAPLVGYYYPYGRFLTWPFIVVDKQKCEGTDDGTDSKKNENPNYKTLSGSIAFWIGSIIGYYILASVALLTPFERANGDKDDGDGTSISFIPLLVVMKIATTSAIAESLTGPYDNIAVAVTAGLTYYFLVKSV
jgi:dolichol kinase